MSFLSQRKVTIQNPTKTAKVEARLPQRDRDQIEARAEALGMSVSAFVRVALRTYLAMQQGVFDAGR